MRVACVLASCFIAACGPDRSITVTEIDAAIEQTDASDAAIEDAIAREDAGEDADVLGADAEAHDSGYGGCSINGVPGDCVDVSECTGDREATPGFCPGPSSIQCCTERGASFDCDPSEHKFPNEGLVEETGMDGCPAGMIRIPDGPYCIDRFEASLLLVHEDGTTTSWSPYHHPDTERVRAVSLRAAVPQGYVDGVTAARACEDAGKRLCTDAEWLRACRGPDELTYPYGDTRMDGWCNDARAMHPAVELFPDDPTPFDRIQDACINQLPHSLDATGARSMCITADGAFDMMGNLHEWTADPAGTFRGGFYVDTVLNGPGCLYATTAHNTMHWDYSTGFRCCSDL